MFDSDDIFQLILLNNIGPIGYAFSVNGVPLFQPENINFGPPELHFIIDFLASATNVINYSGQSSNHNSPGTDAASDDVPDSIIHNIDGRNGSNTVITPYDCDPLTVFATGGVTGRYDMFTVINNLNAVKK